MSALSPQQINQSYQGLLKLSDSTTGITSTLQAVEDGLGNDTGLNIATNRLEGGNLYNVYKPQPAKFYGTGFSSTPLTPGGIQNQLMSGIFYDNGIQSYSAFTINCTTLEAGASMDFALYSAQYLEPYGYVPYQKLTTEINLSAASTGFKVGTFSSHVSFSGTGPGFYFAVARYNTGGTPVCRFGAPAITQSQGMNVFISQNLGFVSNTAGTGYIVPFQVISTSNANSGINVYNTPTFPSTWTSVELATLSSTPTGYLVPGFILHTVI